MPPLWNTQLLIFYGWYVGAKGSPDLFFALLAQKTVFCALFVYLRASFQKSWKNLTQLQNYLNLMVCISYMRIYPRFYSIGCRRQLYNDCGVLTILHTCVLKTTNHLKILREFPRQTKLYRSACLLLSNGTPSKTRLHVFGKSFSPKKCLFCRQKIFLSPVHELCIPFFNFFR